MGIRIQAYLFYNALPEGFTVRIVQLVVYFAPVPGKLLLDWIERFYRNDIICTFRFQFFFKPGILIVIIIHRDPSFLEEEVETFQLGHDLDRIILFLYKLFLMFLNLKDTAVQFRVDMVEKISLQEMFREGRRAVGFSVFLLTLIAFIFCDMSILTLVTPLESGQMASAVRADNHLAEKVRLIRGGVDLSLAGIQYPGVLIGSDIWITIAGPAIPHPGIDFTCEHPVDLILGRRLILVGIPGIEYGGPFGIACEVVTENVFHDSACPGILLKMLINIFISEWNRSIEMFLIALLMLEHNLDTLRSAVRQIGRAHV